MALLAPLTSLELAELAHRIMSALRDVTAELDLLDRTPPEVRDWLYGPRVREITAGLRDDLADLMSTDIAASFTMQITRG